jgi:hypothetical protein
MSTSRLYRTCFFKLSTDILIFGVMRRMLASFQGQSTTTCDAQRHNLRSVISFPLLIHQKLFPGTKSNCLFFLFPERELSFSSFYQTKNQTIKTLQGHATISFCQPHIDLKRFHYSGTTQPDHKRYRYCIVHSNWN